MSSKASRLQFTHQSFEVPAFSNKNSISWIYHRRFLQNISSLTFPLRQLQNRIKYKWTPECETAFTELKNQIASDQTLIAYNPDLPVTVACDASPNGIKAILSHIIDGKESSGIHVQISYSSRAKL